MQEYLNKEEYGGERAETDNLHGNIPVIAHIDTREWTINWHTKY